MESDAQPKQVIYYKGRTLDVGRWMARHPGGPLPIEHQLGTDVTCAMHMFHDMRHKGTQKMVAKLDAGPAPDHPLSDFDRDYLELEALFVERGWFEASRSYFTLKTLWVFAWLVAAVLVEASWLKGLLFGMFIQQAAFMAHDTCHDSVGVPRRRRNAVCWFFGSLCFGLNYAKWTREHNLHHAINSRPLDDPQLNNMPDLIYAYREVENFEKKKRPVRTGEKWLMGYQAYWLVPVLLLYGRINAVRAEIKRSREAGETHYLWAIGLHVALWGLMIAQGYDHLLRHTLVFVPIALAVSGIIHIQLILSHAYRPRLFADEQRLVGGKIQIISNQNMTTTWINGWFHGGLDLHIEHHLFPRLPRHSLRKAQPHVKALCQKHHLPYQTKLFPVSVWQMLRSLHRQGAPFRAELAELRRRRGTAASA